MQTKSETYIYTVDGIEDRIYVAELKNNEVIAEIFGEDKNQIAKIVSSYKEILAENEKMKKDILRLIHAAEDIHPLFLGLVEEFEQRMGKDCISTKMIAKKLENSKKAVEAAKV